MDYDARYAQLRTVTLVGALVNILLAVGKVLAGWLGQSQALIADGIHSFSDLLSDALILVAAKHASRGADLDHPYGHARIETAVSVLLGGLLMLVGLGIAIDAARRLWQPDALWHPGGLAMAAAALSVLAKEWLYRYTLRAAKQQRSPMMEANAWHHRSDAISSLLVLIGVGGVMAGLPYLDALAAVGVAGMIAHIGWGLSWNGLRELVDTALDPEQLAQLRQRISAVDGVAALHSLRTRHMGADALVEVHVLVASTLSVSEGHQIGDRVRLQLMTDMEGISDVTVHIDPEDDELVSPCALLPLRQELLDKLKQRWKDVAAAHSPVQITLHYLSGGIQVEVVLALSVLEELSQAEQVALQLSEAAKGLECIDTVRVFFVSVH